MSDDYISRSWLLKNTNTGMGVIELMQAIIDAPAADVVEVDVKDLRVKKAIQTLFEFYSTAKKSDYVQKPLAWALYQTWKSFDKMDGGVNDGIN